MPKTKKITFASAFKKKVLFEVDHSDLENFIEQETGKRLELVEILEVANGECVSATASRKAATDPWNKKEVAALKDFFEKDGEEPDHIFIDSILSYLCRKKIIEPGDYLIQVDW